MLILNSFEISMYVKVLRTSFKQFRGNRQLVRTNRYCLLLSICYTLKLLLSILRRELPEDYILCAFEVDSNPKNCGGFTFKDDLLVAGITLTTTK